MKERDYLEQADKLMERIKRGAFLTVKADDIVNTMTIGWATIGYNGKGLFSWLPLGIRDTLSHCLKKLTILLLRFRMVTNKTRLFLFAARNQEEILISLKNVICSKNRQGVR